MPQLDSDVVIVGGGISGLSAAHAILRRKPDLGVVVVEAAARAGGLLGSERKEGYLCESGANAFLAGSAGTAADLAGALGLDLVSANAAAKRRWIYRQGRLRELPTSPPKLLSTDLLSVGARLRLLLEPFASAAPIAEESVAQWGRRRLGTQATEAVLGPFVLGVFAGDAEKLSVEAALPRLAELEAQHGGLLRGLIASRGRGMPKLVAPRDGVEGLVRTLAAFLGPRLRLATRAVALERTAGGHVVNLDGGRQIEARKVVLAVPPRAAAVLVAGHDERLAARLRACPAVGVAVVHVGLAPDDVRHPLDGFGFLVANDEDVRCLGCVFESSVWPDRAPPGHALLRLIYGGARDPGLLALGDGEIARIADDDLERVLGLRQRVAPLQILRWPNAIPQYQIGHRAWVDEVERGAAALGLVLAGNAYHGVSVNDCVKDSERVADAVADLTPTARQASATERASSESAP